MNLTLGRAVAIIMMKIGGSVIMLTLEDWYNILVPTLVLHKILGTHYKKRVSFSVLATLKFKGIKR